MTGSDISRRRSAIGLTLEDLARALHEHPDQVRAWEGIEGTLPRSLARRLDWTLALEEREAAVKGGPIRFSPACSRDPRGWAVSSWFDPEIGMARGLGPFSTPVRPARASAHWLFATTGSTGWAV
jgi:hypothetical protein